MPAEGKEVFPSPFGRYTLVERLATGGMAEVFRAKILSAHGFEKLLVIKRILTHLAVDKTFVAMFIDEAKLTAQLLHPKIVQVMDFGEVDWQYFIALEFIDGFDALALLRAAAQKQVRLPIPICMHIASEVLDALDYAHNAKDLSGKPMQLVHRDISPSNVFISRRGDVKLADFGIAHAQERESKTQAGTLKGKYGYMSPEQVMGGGIDCRSDLFAVAIVLAEMLMGRRLFTAPNDLDVLLMVRDGRIERLDKYCQHVPADLDKLLRKGLAKRAADRYQTAAEFRDAVADLLFSMGFRIGAPDVGRLALDYLDPSPEAHERLRDLAKKWEVAAPGGKGQGGVTLSPAISLFLPTPDIATPSSPAAAAPEPAQPDDVVVDDLGGEPEARQPTPEPRHRHPVAVDPAVFSALDQAFSKPLAVVELDHYAAPSAPHGAATLVPVAEPPPAGRRATPFVPAQPPDHSGDLSVISAVRAFSDLAVGQETGLLRCETAGAIKDVFLVRGAPETINVDQSGDRFGEYLVARGFLRQPDLDRALTQIARHQGKLGDTLVALGLMRPKDTFRLLSQHVRERVMDLFTWVEGSFSFYRGRKNPVEGFPLGLDSFEILGAGIVGLPLDFLRGRFAQLGEFLPRAVLDPRIKPEAFRLGNTPRELWAALDGHLTVGQWIARFTSQSDLTTFLRTLYLLLETDSARLE